MLRDKHPPALAYMWMLKWQASQKAGLETGQSIRRSHLSRLLFLSRSSSELPALRLWPSAQYRLPEYLCFVEQISTGLSYSCRQPQLADAHNPSTWKLCEYPSLSMMCSLACMLVSCSTETLHRCRGASDDPELAEALPGWVQGNVWHMQLQRDSPSAPARDLAACLGAWDRSTSMPMASVPAS